MRTRGQFSKPAAFNYQSHQSLQKFRKVPLEQRAEEVVQDIFKIKVKGQQNSKLIVARNSAPSKQQQIKQLKKHIKLIENQLKKKILDNPILGRIFKTKQPTNGQMAHLDLYLEFIKLKEEQQNSQKRAEQVVEQHKQKQMAYELEIAQLKEQKQQRQHSFIMQIEKATQQFDKIQREFQKKLSEKEKMFEKQTIERESRLQDNNLILEELKRKNHKLIKENKQLETKFNECRKSEQDKLKSLKGQLQTCRKKAEQEKIILQEEIQKNSKNYQAAQQKLCIKINELQNELAQKTLQVQELDRFIELQKDSFDTQIQSLQHSYETKLKQLTFQKNEKIETQKRYVQDQIRANLKLNNEKINGLTEKYQKQMAKLRLQYDQSQLKVSELQTALDQKGKSLKRLQQETKNYNIQFETELQTYKKSHQSMIQQKQSLLKKLHQTEIKVEKLSKQIQFLTHQKNEFQSKYEKGFMNSQHDIKHYQGIIDELERKIYIFGNENIGLKKALEEKNITQNKVKEYNRISEEAYQQKYKAIGRIEEIRHKLENFLISDMTKGFSNNFSVSCNNYKSNSSNSNSLLSLNESIEGLTMALDKMIDNCITLNQSIQNFRKQKQYDEREIESILNHLLDMEQREQDLDEALINYINLRKELNKQTISSTGLYCGQENLIEKKRELSQFVIEKLIQLKVIKQYSSADQLPSSYRIPKDEFFYPKKQLNQLDFSSYQSNNYFSSSINNGSKNSRKSLKKLVSQEQYHSNEDFVNQKDEYDSLDNTKRTTNSKKLFQDSANRVNQARMSKIKRIQSSKNKLNSKYCQRMLTEPNKYEDGIEQQSTYEIIDENIDYVNLTNRQTSKPKLMNEKESHCNAGIVTADRQQLNKQYKQRIKEKLTSGKGKRETGIGLSKEDIEKKYFIR